MFQESSGFNRGIIQQANLHPLVPRVKSLQHTDKRKPQKKKRRSGWEWKVLKLRMHRARFSYAKTMAETESLIKIHLQAISKCLIEHNYHLIHSLLLIRNFFWFGLNTKSEQCCRRKSFQFIIWFAQFE